MGAKIDIISRELIKPSSPTPNERKEHKLSLLDQMAPYGFVPLLFFYNSKVVDPSKSSLHLKQSLSESLTKFYPLAGKLNPLSIECDDSGALFVKAKVDAPFSQAVQNASFESFVQYLPFDPFPPPPPDGDELLLGTYPENEVLFAVQITWFECGSSAIGVCISHKVGDFASLVTFMNSWAATNRGEISTSKSLVLKDPSFDTGRQLFPPLDFPLKIPPVTTAKGKLVLKRFVFNKEKLTELKKLAISSSSVKDPTRVEVITSFLWKQFIKLARAKHEAAAKAFMFRLWHAVSLRSRMSSLAAISKDDPFFPSGNFFVMSSASFSATDQEDRDFGDLVWLTRTAIRGVNDDYVLNSVVPSLKSLATGGTMEHVQQPTTLTSTVTSDWFFTSWCGFSTYEVDFGWGKPIWVGPAGVPNFSGVTLTSRSGDQEDGIEAWITILEDELAFLPDEILTVSATDYFHGMNG